MLARTPRVVTPELEPMVLYEHPASTLGAAMMVGGVMLTLGVMVNALRGGNPWSWVVFTAPLLPLGWLLTRIVRGPALAAGRDLLGRMPVVVAGVVQANGVLRQPGPEDGAFAVLVFALQEPQSLDPNWAQGAANFLAGVRARNRNHPDLMFLHFQLNNEREMFTKELPADLMNGTRAVVTVVFVPRDRLMNGVIPHHGVIAAAIDERHMAKNPVYGIVPWQAYT